jgi:protein O-GlcNAc transferase
MVKGRIASMLDRGLAHHQLGQLDQAEKIYREILHIQPAHADALYLLGTIFYQRSNFTSAQLFLRKAVAAFPQHAEALHNLGLTFEKLGRWAESKSTYDQLLKHCPDHADAYFNRGNIHRLQNDLVLAEQDYRRALTLKPHWAEALDNLGLVLRLEGRWTEARAVCAEAHRISPDLLGPMLNLGAIAKSLADLDEADQFFTKAIEQFPRSASAHTNLGIVAAHRKDWPKAEHHARQAVLLDPRSAVAQNNLGLVLFLLAREAEAAEAFRAAIAIDPDFADAINNLGSTLYRLNQLPEALASYQASLRLKESPTTLKNLGSILEHVCAWSESAESFRAASRWRKNDPVLALRSMLVCPTVFDSVEEIEDYRNDLESKLATWGDQAITLPADEWLDADIRPSFAWQFQGRCDRRLRELLSRCVSTSFPKEKPTTTMDGPPTAGFLVAPGHEYAFVRSIGGMFAHFDRRHWRPCILGAPSSEPKLRSTLGESLDFVPLPSDLPGMVEAIRSASIGLLYHWEIGTSAMNYLLPFCCPAPRQVTSWGIQVTSGIDAVDYYLSSKHVEADDADTHYTEKLVRLDTMLSYQQPMPIPENPLSRTSLGLPQRGNIYLCAQQLGKFHPSFDTLLSQILSEDPDGYLVLTRSDYEPEQNRLLIRWRQTLADVHDRLVWIPKQVGQAYASLIHAADVVLDPIQFGGVNTTYDALSAGRATVTWPSHLHRGRYTLGCFRRMEMLDTVARSAEDYVQLAVHLGRDRDFRRSIEDKIIERRPILFSSQESARELESWMIATLTTHPSATG